MNEFTNWQGSRVDLEIDQGEDTSSISATFYAKGKNTATVIEKTGTFVDGIADVSLNPTDTAVPDVYEFLIIENFADEEPRKYPDPNNCQGDNCTLPTFTICAAPDEVVGEES